MTKHSTTRFTLKAAASAFALAISIGAASAQERVSFDIESQPLSRALLEFNEQSGLTVAAPSDLVNGRTASAVEGSLEPSEALTLMLADSGLSVRELPNGALTIVASQVEQSEAEARERSFRTASVAQEVSRVGRQPVEVAEPEEVDGEVDPSPRDVITVTGTSIRGVYPDSQPLQVFTAEEIELSGATTVNRFLETLPQNVNSVAPGSLRFLESFGVDAEPSDTGIADLRGFGPGTTLTLLNGRRLAAPDGGSINTALIPLGLVDRIEVLTDGASAVYGSDAIGGVVNFILRDDFDGAELSVSYGAATRGGHDRTQVGAATGRTWDSGSGFLSYSFLSQSDLDVSERDFSSQAPAPETMYPAENTHNIMLGLDQSISDRINFFGTALYTARESDSVSPGVGGDFSTTVEEEQLFLSGGLQFELSPDLTLQVDATYLVDDLESTSDFVLGGMEERILSYSEGEAFDLVAKIDGRLLTLPSGDVRFSVGGGYSEQDFETAVATDVTQGFDVPDDLSRNSSFAFAEGFLPLVSPSQNIRGVHRLELSGAIRYTEYSDFEGAATPRFGVLWSPIEGVNFRSTYSRGFRAPTLTRFSPSGILLFAPGLLGFPDPFSNDQSSVYLFPAGVNPNGLTAEFSDTYTVGFDLSPTMIPGLNISVTYYSIDYEDRLAFPVDNVGPLLVNPLDFGFIINSSPTRAEILDALASFSRVRDFSFRLPADPTVEQIADVVTVIVDNRFTNLASSKSEGIDANIGHVRDTEYGSIRLGLNTSYTIESSQQLFADSPVLSNLDVVGSPNSLRANVYAGLSAGNFNGRATVRYVNGYDNTSISPVGSVDSWVTTDLNLNYRLGDSYGSVLSGSMVSLTIQNLFDSDPPFVATSGISGTPGLVLPVGFDPVNANPLGRFVTVSIRKQF